MVKRLFSLIKNNAFFFTSIAFLCIASCIFLYAYTKETGFILLNPYHREILNKAFYFFTKLGNGWCMVLVAGLYLILNRKKLALLVISSFLLSGLLAQVLKYSLPEARPAILLEKSNYPYFIQHITLHSYSSFPSGHSASAFALAAVLTFYFPNKWWSVPLFLYACLVGYSRIYLGDHFLIDVISGAVIGLASAIACWIVMEINNQFNNKRITT